MTQHVIDDVWNDIVATLELGSGLRFVLVETVGTKMLKKLRQRLQRHLKKPGKSLRSPAAGQHALDWLSQEQTQPGTGEPPDEMRWVLVSRNGTERFFLHWLNEGRDNLRRNLRGCFTTFRWAFSPDPTLSISHISPTSLLRGFGGGAPIVNWAEGKCRKTRSVLSAFFLTGVEREALNLS